MAHYKEIEEYRCFTGPAELHKTINSFLGLLEGVAIDQVVDEQEMLELKNWYELHRALIDRHPFSEIIPALDLALSDHIITYDEAEDLRFLCHQVVSDGYYDLVTSAIQVLHGIIHGILANNEISDDEIYQLQIWMEDHSILKGTYPFDEIYSLMYAVLEDGVITDHERNLLKAFFAEFVDTRDSYNLNANELSALKETYSVQGICAKKPDIFIPEHVFCFTGKSSEATRDEIADMIERRGGVFSGCVTDAVEYLIVGVGGSPCWAYSCYGRKIEDAVSRRKKGKSIVIVNEHDFWDALEAM